MKLSHLPLIGLTLSSNALAQEETTSFAPSLEFVAGVPPGTLPINRRSSLAADIHGTLGLTLNGNPLVDLGTNLGVSIDNWEVKPLGAHLHCLDDETCEAAYSFETYGTLNSDWALGAGMGIGKEGITEVRFPVAWRGFAFTPSIHHEEGDWHPAIQMTAVWQLAPQFSLGPSCQFSEELINCGASLWFAHAHPH